MSKMKGNEDRIEKKLKEVSNENRKLVDPLREARERVADLQRQLTGYNKDKASLAVSRQPCQCITKLPVIPMHY